MVGRLVEQHVVVLHAQDLWCVAFGVDWMNGVFFRRFFGGGTLSSHVQATTTTIITTYREDDAALLAVAERRDLGRLHAPRDAVAAD